MPSDKKRVNLTVPDSIYEQLQEYKAQNGITNDASACLQLIVQQLKAQENTKAFLSLIQNNSYDQLMSMSQDGFSYAKEVLGTQNKAAENPQK